MVRCTSYCWNNSAFQSIGSLSFFCFEAPPKLMPPNHRHNPRAASVAKRQFFVNWVWVCHSTSRILGQGTLEWQQWSTGRCGGRGPGVFVPWHSGNFRPYSFIPVVPRLAGGGSFRGESTKEFASRMCAGRRW